jgi:hypothetical protein
MDAVRKSLHRRRKHHQPIVASKRRFARTFGMRHQADDVPLSVANAGDVVDRSIGIAGIASATGFIGVTEDDLPVGLEVCNRVGWRVVVALAVGDWQAQDLSRLACRPDVTRT